MSFWEAHIQVLEGAYWEFHLAELDDFALALLRRCFLHFDTNLVRLNGKAACPFSDLVVR